ncbi:MAG: maltose alpha-D-glucosyltransferase [Anaerolineales bacterium]
MSDDLWYKRAVFYELYPKAFKDGNGDGWGDFIGLLSQVDHLAELGVDCVWITPFYPSPMFDDGYDVADYYSVDEKFGTLDDFKAVVDALHARDIRIITDLVMNHTSSHHPWFIEAASSRDNPKRNWYVWSNTDQQYKEARIIFVDSQDSNWTYHPETEQYYWHRFYPQQPDLNYDNPEVRDEMFRVVDFWLELGLDGFRADAVPYLFERDGTNCENLPETHQFLKDLRKHMDLHWPGRILLAEANQWPHDTREYFGDGDEMHMGFHFPVMPRLYMALKREDRTSIVDILNATPDIPDNTQWCTFLRNHDELTLEMVTAEDRDYMWEQYAPEPRMRLNLGIRRRLAPLLNNDRRRIELLNAMLFSLPGSPIIYYGDEIGMGDNIYLEDRNGVRTPMQWHSGSNAGFSEADPEALYAPLIQDDEYHYQAVNVAAQRDQPNSLLNRMKHMIGIRKSYWVFGVGTFAFELPDNDAVLAYWRAFERHKILIVANLSAEEQTCQFQLPVFAGHTPLDLLTGERWPTITGKYYDITLAPYQCCWLEIENPLENR